MKIKINHMLFYVVIIAFLEPRFLNLNDKYLIISQGFALIRYLITIIMFGCVFLNRSFRNSLKNIHMFLLCCMVLFMCIASVKNGSTQFTFFMSLLAILGCCLVNTWFYIYNKNFFILAYSRVLNTYIFLHFISLLLNLLDFNVSPFLGMKNAFTSVAIVAVLTNLMKNNMKKRSNINDIVYCAYILIVAILNQSTTAIAIILAIILFVLFYKLIGTLGKENRKKLFRYISIGVVVITIGLIIYIINGQNNGLIDFVTEKLGKDSTFSGRRAIWAQAVKFVIQSPLWGKGQSVVYDVWMNGVQVYSAHNTFLDFAVKYGCIATGLFLADLMIVILFACYNSDERIKNMLLIIMLVFIVAMLPEAMEGFYETWTVVQCVYMYSCGDKLFDMFEKKRIFKRRRK